MISARQEVNPLTGHVQDGHMRDRRSIDVLVMGCVTGSDDDVDMLLLRML